MIFLVSGERTVNGDRHIQFCGDWNNAVAEVYVHRMNKPHLTLCFPVVDQANAVLRELVSARDQRRASTVTINGNAIQGTDIPLNRRGRSGLEAALV